MAVPPLFLPSPVESPKTAQLSGEPFIRRRKKHHRDFISPAVNSLWLDTHLTLSLLASPTHPPTPHEYSHSHISSQQFSCSRTAAVILPVVSEGATSHYLGKGGYSLNAGCFVPAKARAHIDRASRGHQRVTGVWAVAPFSRGGGTLRLCARDWGLYVALFGAHAPPPRIADEDSPAGCYMPTRRTSGPLKPGTLWLSGPLGKQDKKKSQVPHLLKLSVSIKQAIIIHNQHWYTMWDIWGGRGRRWGWLWGNCSSLWQAALHSNKAMTHLSLSVWCGGCFPISLKPHRWIGFEEPELT